MLNVEELRNLLQSNSGDWSGGALSKFYPLLQEIGVGIINSPSNSGIASLSYDASTKKWCIKINKAIYDTLDDRSKDAIFYHEFLHFLRGDPIYVLERNLDAKLWNVASDVVMNEHWLDAPFVRENGLTFNTLRQMGIKEEDVPYTRDAMVVYMQLKTMINDHLRQMLAPSDFDVPDKEKMSEAAKQWAKSVALYRALYRDAEKILDEDVRRALDNIEKALMKGVGSLDSGDKWEGKYLLPPPAPPTWYTEWLAWYHSIQSKLNSIGILRKPCRTYRREGLVDGMSFQYYKNIAKDIHIFVDVSGSMDYYRSCVLADAMYLQQQWNVSVYVFAERCVKCTNSKYYENVGTGTLWRPVEKVIQSLPPSAAVVIISDLMFADVENIPVNDRYLVIAVNND